ncbi:MAG: hypothetical protein ABUS79_02025 [Pseudomonadota bacterium]
MGQVTFRSSLSAALLALAASSAAVGCAPQDPSVPMDAATTVTYAKDVQPILIAKCSPCHAGERQGFHNIATTYADAHKNVDSIDSVGCWKDTVPGEFNMPKTVGECALISIMNGRMPMAQGCAQSPRPAACVTTAQQQIIAAWVAAGMPQ